MADAEAAAAPPRGPAQTRRSAEAAALRGTLVLATDALYRCFIGAVWLKAATNAAFVAARSAFGGNSRAAAVAKKFSTATLFALALVVYLGLLLLSLRLWIGSPKANKDAEIGERGGDATRPSAQRRRPESTGARIRRKSIYGPVAEAIYYTSGIIMCVGLVMHSHAQGKRSCMGRVGYMAADIGCFVNAVVFCSIITPRHVIWLKARYGRICIPM